MAADIVNLRSERKRRARAERDRVAEERRRQFGRSRAEKDKAAAESAKADRTLDGHRLTPEPDGRSGAD